MAFVTLEKGLSSVEGYTTIQDPQLSVWTLECLCRSIVSCGHLLVSCAVGQRCEHVPFSLARSRHKMWQAASLLGNRISDQLEVLNLDPASVLQVCTL